MSSPKQPPTRPAVTYAVWRSQTFEATPSARPPGSVKLYSPDRPDEAWSATRTGRWSRVVPATEAELYRVRTTCQWQGEPFSVEGSTPGGRLQLTYLGRDHRRAEDLGLTMAEPGVYVTTAAPDEVTGPEQVRSPV